MYMNKTIISAKTLLTELAEKHWFAGEGEVSASKVQYHTDKYHKIHGVITDLGKLGSI